MAILKRIFQSMWWLALAYVPVALSNAIDHLYDELGCSLHGDCYVPGTGAGFALEVMDLKIAMLVWPACIWFLGLRWVVTRLGISSFLRNAFGPKRPHRSD